MECNKSGTKREVYRNTGLPQETRNKSQRNNLTLHLNELEKKGKNEAQSQYKKGNNKDQSGNK